MIKRPTKPAHFSSVVNPKTFDQAYQSISSGVIEMYYTNAGTPFTAQAGITQRGRHAEERVIIFRQNGKETARAYECCWGYKTNCNRTYIDSYTPCV